MVQKRPASSTRLMTCHFENCATGYLLFIVGADAMDRQILTSIILNHSTRSFDLETPESSEDSRSRRVRSSVMIPHRTAKRRSSSLFRSPVGLLKAFRWSSPYFTPM
jgi:hypothetical protein